jgi:predicted metalloprotease with PDZ domain
MNKTLLGALALLPFGVLASPLHSQTVADVRYDVVFTAETAARREIHVEMSFEVSSDAPVALSLPAWTPGAYELSDFAKNLRAVWARQSGSEIRWDKADFDTWRVYPNGRGQVTIGFDYLADELDNSAAWAKPDFAFFNGTNLFFFPEGGDLGFESIVTFHTEPGWRVATGLTALSASEYTASDYHELVDMPTFVGLFDLDSARVDDHWQRLATYPAGAMAGAPRSTLWDQIHRMMPPMEAVF